MDIIKESYGIKKPLAYRIYPLPNGTDYWEDDLRDEEMVEILFDFAQIQEAIIHKTGWEFMINLYGYERLYEINQRSSWFDCENVEQFKRYVEEAMDWDSNHY